MKRKKIKFGKNISIKFEIFKKILKLFLTKEKCFRLHNLAYFWKNII